MNRYPDNPQLVSSEFLRQIDTQEPGRWIAQPKLDGWRRLAWRSNGVWNYQAKHTTGPAAKALPPELVAEFECLPWPDDIGLDMEWMGTRSGAGKHSLHIFDLLMFGHWLGAMSFAHRYEMLRKVVVTSHNVKLVPIFYNPGLVDLFIAQMADPMSEGLVIRRKDSKLIGSTERCSTNPLWLKVKFRDTTGGQR